MATATGYTAARMKAIEDSCITSGAVLLDHLVLTRHDGTTIDAGNVRGLKGDKGDPGTPGLNAAPGDVNATPNTTPIRTSDGRVKTAPATQSDDAVQLARLTDGTKTVTISQLRLKSSTDASATSTTHAFQIGDDTGQNVIVDNNEIVSRNNGVLSKLWLGFGAQVDTTITPGPSELTHRTYVDSLVAGIELAGGVDLNTITTAGAYSQSQNADATSGSNYPVQLAGLLEVSTNVNGSGTMAWQRYRPYNTNAIDVFYERAWYSANGWSPWRMYSPSDVPWTTYSSFASSVTTLVATGYGPFRYRVVGDKVELNGPVQTTIARTGNWIAMTLPAALKPKYHQQVKFTSGYVAGYGVTAGLYFSGMAYVDAGTGVLTVYVGASATMAANGYVFFDDSYPLS